MPACTTAATTERRIREVEVDGDDAASPGPAARTGDLSEQPLLVTPARLQRMEEELRTLQTVRRPEVAEQIRYAIGLGDVTESSEYQDAKTEQAFVESRISELQQILGAALVLDVSEIPTDCVGVGSLVTIKNLATGEEWELAITSPVEADPDSDLISNECPVGEALCGRRVGERVRVRVPAGEADYQILALRPWSEAAGSAPPARADALADPAMPTINDG